MESRNSIFHNVKDDRQFRASTGLSKEEFKKLSERFAQFYKPKVHQVTENYTIERTVQNPSEGLFFILYYKKNYPTFDILGLCFGFSNKTVHDYVKLFKGILHQCLSSEEMLPKRIFTDEKEMEEFFGL
jgi:hypothetical protein